MQVFQQFTNKYSLSKTLRFELIPQGKTLENIRSKGLIAQDEQRAEQYKKAKQIINKYHQFFIDEILGSVCISDELLQSYANLYFSLKKNDDEKLEVDFKNVKEAIKKQISNHISSSVKFKNLFKKELIDAGKKESDLIVWLNACKEQNISLFAKNQDIRDIDGAIQIIRDFKGWTTYFTGFHENRKNVYSTDDIPTSIIFRIVNELDCTLKVLN